MHDHTAYMKEYYHSTPERKAKAKARVNSYRLANKDLIKNKRRASCALNKSRAEAMQLELGCADCGYAADVRALHWDHLPGFKKKANVSSLYGSWKATMAEILKCEVVCANCHMIRTAERF